MSYASQKTQVAFSPDTLAQSLPGKAEMSFHCQSCLMKQFIWVRIEQYDFSYPLNESWTQFSCISYTDYNKFSHYS